MTDFEKWLEDREPREKLQEEFIERIIDGMDMDGLLQYASERLNDYYDDLSDEELNEAVKKFYPDLLENN